MDNCHNLMLFEHPPSNEWMVIEDEKGRSWRDIDEPEDVRDMYTVVVVAVVLCSY